MSYIIDVYKKESVAQKNILKLALFITFFPQLIAGPILKYQDIYKQIDSREITINKIIIGSKRFVIGLAKKMLLANILGGAVDKIFMQSPTEITTFLAWFGALAFTMQLYFDFGGYSDMAIGMGRMVGFHYMENFNYPYTAVSVQDFWRRWHISLSSFFRDYVYIPLGGSRCSQAKYIRNMCVVWFLTGLWHGASWNFIFWGLYYLVFLLLEKFVIGDRIPGALKHIYTLLVVYFGWILFRFTDLHELGTALKCMIGLGGGFTSMAVTTQFMGHIFFLLFALVAVTPLGKKLRRILYELGKDNRIIYNIFNITEMLTPVLLLILSMLALIGDSYNPFLYFQF